MNTPALSGGCMLYTNLTPTDRSAEGTSELG